MRKMPRNTALIVVVAGVIILGVSWWVWPRQERYLCTALLSTGECPENLTKHP